MFRIVKGPALAQALILVAGLGLVAWDMTTGLVVGLLWLFPILVAMDLGAKRNRTGWMWGLFLGWLGVVILACLGYMPSEAEREVREIEATRRLEELRRAG
jgi:hypothetical protein